MVHKANLFYKKRDFHITHSVLFVLFSLMLIIFSFCLVKTGNTIYAISIIAFCGSFFFLKNTGSKILSFPVFMLVLIFVFHCSYYVLWLFQYKIPDVVVGYISDEMWIEACKFSIVFMLVYSFGIGTSRKKKNFVLCSRSISNKRIRRVGVMMTWFFLLPRVFVDISLLAAFLRGGYASTFSAVTSGIMEVLAEGFYFGIIFSIVGYRDNHTICRRLLLFATLVSIIGMLSGRRLEKVVFLITIALIYFKFVNRSRATGNSLRKIGIILACYIFVAFVMTLTDFRSGAIFSVGTFMNLFLRNVTYKMILEIMVEFGYTSYTLAATIATFPNTGTGFGLNYVTSLVQIIPNIGGIYSSLIKDMCFVNMIPSTYQYWLGGSLLGELFYNFGYFSIPLMFVLGRLTGDISHNVESALCENCFSIMDIASIILIPLFFIWVRGDFTYIPRPLVWYVIIIAALSKVKFTHSRL